jgi:16S rRNA (guanine966-N2)-methyltransferase
MRIIAGSKRGMNLLPPKGFDTRPITDRVKESLFSVLYKYDVIPNGIVSDVFAGTGSLGLEALSRGARWCTFIEKARHTADILNRNIEKAAFVAESKVISADAFSIGAGDASANIGSELYDLVFVDPPFPMTYDTGPKSRLAGLLNIICEQIKDGAIVTVRTNERARLDQAYGRLNVIDRRDWGKMAVTILQSQTRNTKFAFTDEEEIDDQ